MAFTKYATFEGAQVLDLKGSRERAQGASLQKLANFEDYRTDDGYLYARIRGISSRVNKNHDGWPSIELAGGPEVFEQFTHEASANNFKGFTVHANKDHEYGFSTFLGKPIFVDHHNSDPKRARGVIVDAKFHVEDHKTAAKLDPYYASAPEEHLPPAWVELLLEVDAKTFPRLAKAIVEGSKNPDKGIDGFSMGCDVERSVCSICKNSATAPDEFCKHIKLKGHEFKDANGKTSKSYEDCYGIKFFEISAVFDPADETALLREVRSSVYKEAAEQCPTCYGDGNIDGEMCPTCHGNQVVNPPGSEGTPDTFPEEWSHMDEPGKETVPPEFQTKPADREHIIHSLLQSATEQFQQNKHDVSTIIQALNSALVKSGIAPDTASAAVQEWQHSLDRPGAEAPPEEMNFDSPKFEGSPAEYLARIARKYADHPLPQADHIKAPENINTLRKEKVCDVCGSTMDDETCDVCGYTEPPDGFDNPDLDKAKQNVEDNTDQQTGQPGEDVERADVPNEEPSNPALLAHVNSDMDWSIDLNSNRTSGQINPVEKPILPSSSSSAKGTNEQVLEDQSTAVTSSVRTARDFIAAAGATNRRKMNHTADAASGAPAVAKPDVNVDVVGVGGVDQASNEQASKADAQIDVAGVGGTGVEGVSSDSSSTLPEADAKGDGAGFDTKKNIESIPTKTFDDGSSAVERQADPISSEPFPASDEGVKQSGWIVEGYDDGPFPASDEGAGGGTAVKGVQPIAEQFGDRLDVLDHVTSPANNSGPTTTWSGTDGNGVLKQQDPVTPDTLEGADLVNLKNGSAHIFSAFKLADLEIELGLIDPSRKYERAAQLEAASPAVVQASLAYAERVKTAGLSRAQKTAKRLPVLGRSAATKESSDEDPTIGDAAIFGR